MKRAMIKLVSVIMLIVMLAGPCAAGEAAERALYRVKLDINAEYMGEMITYYCEACQDEHGCLQETERIGIPGINVDVFAQLGKYGLTLAMNGGEARDISTEDMIRAWLGSFVDERDAKLIAFAYIAGGALMPDARALSALLPAELDRLRAAAISTGLGADTEAGFAANGTIEDILITAAAYLEALSTDAQTLSALGALKVWALSDMTHAEFEQLLPAQILNLASEARAAAAGIAEEGAASSISIRAEGGAFKLNASFSLASSVINLDLDYENKRLSAKLNAIDKTDNGFIASNSTRAQSLNTDFNDLSFDYTSFQEASLSFSFDEEFDISTSSQVSLKYADGAFEYAETVINDSSGHVMQTEQFAAYNDGALNVKLCLEDENGEFEIVTLNADKNRVRLDGRWYENIYGLHRNKVMLGDGDAVKRDQPMHVVSAEITRAAEGVNDISARVGALAAGDEQAGIERELFALGGALDLNGFEFKLNASYEGESVLSINAQADQIPGGEAIFFTADYMGKTISGELGYEAAASGDAGTITLSVLPYLKLNVPGPGGIGDMALRYELPFDIVIAPDGTITADISLALGEVINGAAKLTLEPLDTPPAHVYGAPYDERESDKLINDYIELILAFSERFIGMLSDTQETSASMATVLMPN